MFDVMQTIKDEVLDDKLIQSSKDLVEMTSTQTTAIFICNSKEAKRHLLTIATQMMDSPGWRYIVKRVAKEALADAILTIVTTSFIESQQCMTITVETMLSRYSVVYPYERVGQKVIWEEPRQLPLRDRYGDLLPTPAGMAQA